jgi:signal transduction histidine kinase
MSSGTHLLPHPNDASERGVPTIEEPSSQAAARLRILVEVSRQLAEAKPDLDVVLDTVAAHIVQTLGDACAIYLLNTDEAPLEAVTIRHRIPERNAVMEQLNHARQLRSGEGFVGKAIGLGKSLFLPEADPMFLRSTVLPEHALYLERVGIRSLLVVPLAGKSRVHGALWLSRDPGSPPYTHGDRELIEAIADCAALALDSARLHNELSADRGRLGEAALRTARLQEVTSALSGAATPEEVADIVAHLALGSMEAAAGSLVLPNEARTHLEIVSHVGTTSSLVRRFQSLPVTADNPVARAFREGRELYFEDLERYSAAYPHLREIAKAAGYEGAAALPLKVRNEVLGVLWVRFTTARRFDSEERKLMSNMVAQSAQALERSRLYTRAQQAVAQRDEFLSVAAHELRTPLSAMKLQIQSLQRKLARPALSEEERPQLAAKADAVARQVQRLEALVTDLLDLSRITAGKLALRLEEVDLVELVREVRDRLADEVDRVGSSLTVHATGPLWGLWDRARLDQVLSNLLSNALKYGNGKPIVVTARAEGSQVLLAVHDQGIGISLEDQARIFERFERAVPGRNYSGFGVGLWICKQIVDALGGTIRVQSTPGQGSTFEVVLKGLERRAP